VFNGREPDQHRWDFDPPRLDSYSGRVSWNPTPDWALQASYGYIHSPEQLTPNVSQHRVTASATYNRTLAGGNWQMTFAWGRNYNEPGNVLDGLLLESTVNLGRNTVFARVENVQKDELFLPPSPFDGQVFRVSEATLGYVYDVPVAKHLALGLGVQGTLNLVPSTIKFAYGADPTGYMPFVRLKLR
jgi:outer membrane receptor protein involved in Fe transport